MELSNMYYQESGNFNALGLVVTFVATILFAVGLSFLYALLIYYIPIIYLNIVITVGFGLTIGIVSRILFRLTHNRSKLSRYAIVVLFVIFAYYFHWVAYLLFVFNDGYVSFIDYVSQLNMIFSPSLFIELVSNINSAGLWSIIGATVNGPILTIIWVVEFLIIAILPILSIFRIPIEPYSELCQKKYSKYVLDHEFEPTPPLSLFLPKLEQNPITAIGGLGQSEITRLSKIYVYYLKDENTQYLTFENTYIDNKGKRESEVMIGNFKVSSAVAQQILSEYKYKKSKFNYL